MKIALILGTRPEIIKLSPVIRELQNRRVEYFIIHTNQHYSPGMDQAFFDQLGLPSVKYNLGIKETLHGQMIGKMIIGIETILLDEQPDWVLVQGDTNTVLSGAISASKLGIKIGHIEAGLRSYDRTMPEELNRVLTDHASSELFCPTQSQADILLGEGIPQSMVHVTGNTIVDAVEQNLSIAKRSEYAKKYLGQEYLLLTLHRPSNVDTRSVLAEHITSLTKLSQSLKLPIYYPIHPRTLSKLNEFNIVVDDNCIKVMEPVDYLEMLALQSSAKLILTDSGGIQEEACILQVPCVTLRDNTERPETITVGANMLYGGVGNLLETVNTMLTRPKNWTQPYGDGHASSKIIEFISSYTLQKKSQP